MPGTSTYWEKKRIKVSAIDDLDIDSASDYWEVLFGGPVDVTMIGVLATTGVANAAGTVTIGLYTRPTPGSASGETLNDTMTVTDTTTIAAGKGVYRVLDNPDTDGATGDDGVSTVYSAPSGPIHLEMGESLALKVENAADSGAVVVWIEYIDLGIGGTDLTNDYSEDTT